MGASGLYLENHGGFWWAAGMMGACLVAVVSPGAVPSLPDWLELLAMSLSGFFGAVVAANRRTPAVGVVIAGLLVGLGGGMIRDVLLNTMPVAISQGSILPAVAVAAVIGGLCARWLAESRLALVIIQALMLGLLVVIGAEKAVDFGVSPWAVVVLGVITASAGGAILDALSGMRAALLSQGHWHVTALVGGAAAFLVLFRVAPPWVAEAGTVALIVALRVISYERAWSCPVLPGSKLDL